MYTVDNLTGLIVLVLQLIALAAGVFALIHAIRQRPDAFTAVDKLSKPKWIAILVLALVALLFTSAVQLLGIAGVVAICVYLVDVRPRVDEIQRGPRW